MNLLRTFLYIGGAYLLYRWWSNSKKAPQLEIYERYLKLGDRGPGVQAVQIALNYLGYVVGNIDGIFGNQTEGAVRSFQTDHGLINDGVVGPQTQRAIDEELRRYGGSLIYKGV